MSFETLNLHPAILSSINDCGYTVPTPIQARAIPEALLGRDILASAQTGTGKTAAFMLPALQSLATLKKGPKGAPRVLVLTPTRELAGQVTDATRTYGKNLRIRSAVILGGTPYREQFQALGKPIDLVVATPGRLIDHMDRGSIDLSRLEILILDEADRMLDMGFKEDVEKITAAAPATRQTMLFTATLDKTMADLAQKLLNDPVRIDIAGKTTVVEKIEQRLHVADDLAHKNRMLRHLVSDGKVSQAIIFSATRRDAETLAKELSVEGHRAAALHGDMPQGARNRTVRDLRRGKIRLLVATDVAARGLDVTTITHVINFDLPKFAEDYVHRIGRTGRAGASGTAISFVSGGERAALQRIQTYIGQTLPRYVIEGLEPTRPLEPRPPAKPRKSGALIPSRGNKSAKPAWKKGGNGRPSAKPGYSADRKKREPVIEYRSR